LRALDMLIYYPQVPHHYRPLLCGFSYVSLLRLSPLRQGINGVKTHSYFPHNEYHSLQIRLSLTSKPSLYSLCFALLQRSFRKTSSSDAFTWGSRQLFMFDCCCCFYFKVMKRRHQTYLDFTFACCTGSRVSFNQSPLGSTW
jgi:hypothetical protein